MPRSHGEAQQSQKQPQGSTAASPERPERQDWVLSLTPTQEKQPEQEREEGKERGVRSVCGRAVQSGEELANGQETWPTRPREDLVGCGRKA